MTEAQRKRKREWAREWRKNHPTEARIQYKKQSKLYRERHPEKFKEEVKKGVAAWRLRNPIKNKAHRLVAKAIRKGELEKKPCEHCGKTEVQAHHDDYTKPLDVKWLCKIHHVITHKKARQLL